MPAITITDLNNAKSDVDHIAAVATSTANTATDRKGNVKKTIHKVILDAEARANAELEDVGEAADVAIGNVQSAATQEISDLGDSADAAMVQIVDNIGNHYRDTLAQLEVLTSPKPGAGGIVTDDPDPTNNGWYRKTGAAGAPGWERIADQPASESSVAQVEKDVEAVRPIAERADVNAAPIVPTGEPSNPDYPLSITDPSGNQLLGFNQLLSILQSGFPFAFGKGQARVDSEDSDYDFSIEDEQGNPVFAKKGKQIFGGSAVLGLEDSLHLLSIEDEAGYPLYAVGQDGTVYGGETPATRDGGVDVEGFAAKRAADEVPILDDDEQAVPKQFTTDREMYIGVPFRGMCYSSAEAGAGVDVGWLPLNGDVNIELRHDGSYVFSVLGFAETSGVNTLTRTAGVYTVVNVRRIGSNIVYNVIAGSVVESTTSPIRERSIVFGGQSHIQGGFRNGLVGGLLDGMANVRYRPDVNWVSAPINWTPHCIQGATGATAVSSVSKPECWWMHDTQTDGPALTTWKNAIAAAMAQSQPVPEDVIWAQGEGDTESLYSGAMTLAVHWQDLTALFAEMRAHLISLGATDPQFYIGMLGRGESSGLRAKSQGYTAVRQNYLRLIDETAWVHYGCELYDLPGVYNDIHYSFLGSYTLGYRFARAVNNVRGGQSNSLGPTVVSADLENGGRSVRLTFSAGNTRMPSNPSPPAIIPVGGDAQSTLVGVTNVRVEDSSLVVTADQDLTGCRLIYPDGAVPNARGDSIVYLVGAPHVKMPGLPLRSFITNPLS